MALSDITNALTAAGYGDPDYQVNLRRKRQALQLGEIDLEKARQQQSDLTGYRQALEQSQSPLGGVPTMGVPAGGGLSATAPPELPDPDKVALDYTATRDLDSHAAILKRIGEQAQEIEKRSGPQEATSYFNKKTGMNLQIDKAGRMVEYSDKGVKYFGMQNQQTGEVRATGQLGEPEPLVLKQGDTLLNRETMKPIVAIAPKETGEAEDKKTAYEAYALDNPKLGKTADQLDGRERTAAIAAFKRKTAVSTSDEATNALHRAVLQMTLQEKRTGIATEKTVDSLANAVLDGRTTLQQIRRDTGTRGKIASQVSGAVYAADPNFDESKSEQGWKLRQALVTGPEGKNIASLNTAIVHLDRFSKTVDELGNQSFTPGNKLGVWLKKTFGNSAPATFEGMKAVVAGEMANALKGQSTDIEIANISHTINVASSPQQIKDVVNQYMPALAEKLNTYRERVASLPGGGGYDPVLPSAGKVLAEHGFRTTPRENLPTGGAVHLRSPDGTEEFYTTADKAEKYKAKGATVIP